MSKVPCGGFKLDENFLGMNENDELSLVGGGSEGQLLGKTADGVAWVDPPQSGVQPDWHQNDDTQPDYVKNRPFYTGDPVETMLLEESTVSFTNVSSNIYYGKIPTTVELTAGKTYKVSWDGATYECDCVLVSGFPVIGNQSIISAGADTGEPFLISPLSDNSGTDIYTLDTSASHAISISTFASAELVKIPDKYISDTFRDVVIAGSPLKWSTDDWATYYGLFFSGGKLLRINVDVGSNFIGYVLSMFYSAETEIATITTITIDGRLYYLSKNSTTKEYYWTPVFELNDLYLSYTQTGSDTNKRDREEYYKLGVTNGLVFTTKKANEGAFSQKVVLEGDNEIVLSSSTSGSTKKFKITVDDSGTISATEVTS